MLLDDTIQSLGKAENIRCVCKAFARCDYVTMLCQWEQEVIIGTYQNANITSSLHCKVQSYAMKWRTGWNGHDADVTRSRQSRMRHRRRTQRGFEFDHSSLDVEVVLR